jgi:hypothetical protein
MPWMTGGNRTTPMRHKKRFHPEADLIQKPLVAWARSIGLLLIAVPNGAKRSLAMGTHEVAMGLLAGASDLFLAMPGRSNGMCYHGYWIELKSPGKRPTGNQYVFMERVRSQGYKAEWFDDFAKAKESIEEYIRNEYDAAIS